MKRKLSCLTLIVIFFVCVNCRVEAANYRIPKNRIHEGVFDKLDDYGIDVSDNSEVYLISANMWTESPQIYENNSNKQVKRLSYGNVLKIKTELENGLIKEDFLAFYEQTDNGDYSIVSPAYTDSQIFVWPSYYDIIANGGIYYSKYFNNSNYYYRPEGCAVGVKQVKTGTCAYIEGYYTISGSKYSYPGYTSLGGGEYAILKSVNNPSTGQLYYKFDAPALVFNIMGGGIAGAGQYYTIGFRMLYGNMQYYTAIK